jgi:hypothetical protein
MGRDTGVDKKIGEPPPSEGCLERDLDGLGLEIPERAKQLIWTVVHPAREHNIAHVIECHQVRALAVKVHSDVDHDRASFPVACPSRR